MQAGTHAENQRLLTIAIPTYNRAGYLDLCLARIGEELDCMSADKSRLVKIIVSNNASTDWTAQVIEKYRSIKAGDFEWVQNSENIGADRNIAQCYALAATPYVWVFGDDDVILTGGLNKVLDVLTGSQVDLLYVNNYWFQDEFENKPKGQERHGVSSFTSALEFTRRTNVMLTYLSGIIVRSGIGRNYRSELTGSNLVQLSWVLPLLRDGSHFVVIEDWIIAAKGGNSGGYELVNVFGNNLKRISENILESQPKVARAIQNATIILFFPDFIMTFRKGSSRFADKEMIDGLKQSFRLNWRFYAFLLPLLKLPVFLAYRYYQLLVLWRRIFASSLI